VWCETGAGGGAAAVRGAATVEAERVWPIGRAGAGLPRDLAILDEYKSEFSIVEVCFVVDKKKLIDVKEEKNKKKRKKERKQMFFYVQKFFFFSSG
jgi:hypothetical protein